MMEEIICSNFLDFEGKIKYDLIYLDPPFNSNRDYVISPKENTGFKDKWKEDEYSNFIDKILEKCKTLVKQEGSLFFHISAAEMFIPFSLCKKHFTKVQPIFWKRSRSKNNIKNKPGAVMDVIFWCSLSENPNFYMVYQELDRYYYENSYKNQDERGFYALGHLTTDKTRKSSHLYDITIEGKTFSTPNGWRLDEESLRKLIEDNRIHIPKKEGGKLYKKIYKHENPGKPITDLWDDVASLGQGSEKREYPTQKPLSLLKRIINMTTQEEDWILDPMCGSGTTGLAAKTLKRNCTLIDQNKDAIEICKNRLKVIEGGK